MPRIAYVNGRYVPHRSAVVHVEDRGFQFADAVYEVLPVRGGRVLHLEQHLDRLERSLAELSIAWPVPRRVLPVIAAEVIRRNRMADGAAYIQISRGSAPRNHAFPADAVPSLVVTALALKGPAPSQIEWGVAVVTRPDLRWKRPDIKSVALLPNVLARQEAREEGAFEAWLVDGDGKVTEGTATNAFIVAPSGAIVTRPAGRDILGGITRANVLALAREAGMPVEERAFSVEEALAASEAFATGTTATVLPVTRIDGKPVGDGKPGPVTMRLRAMYQRLREA